MEELMNVDGLMVRQKKEWGEILTGFETRNKYEISDPAGGTMYMAAEVGTSILSRMFLQALRPFEMHILAPDGTPVIVVRRPFKFYFHTIDVYDANDRLLGSLNRHFSMLRRLYTVSDSSGAPKAELFGPILHPWTFEIRRDGTSHGKITKKWSGLGKEAFTDADNFGIEFPPKAPAELRAVLLGAVFLIDFVHFERKGSR